MNAIVFALRGCPAGWLGAYGNEWVATPNLDRLAAEAVVFDQHISDCPDPAAAERAWLRNGFPPGTRAVHIRANRPETDAPHSFYAAFGQQFDARPQEADSSPLDALLRLLTGILDALPATEPWCLWIDIDRLLPPWDIAQDVFEAYIADEDEELENEERIEPLRDPEPGPFDKTDLAAWQWLHASFAAVVTTLDAELGSAFQLLRDRGLDRTAAWIVTSDFGFPLGEHGQVGLLKPLLHEELVHLPLIVRLPNAEQAGRRIDGFTQPADLMRLAAGDFTANRDRAITTLDGAKAIRTHDWAFLAGESPQLFVKPDDRWEAHNVASVHEDVVQALAIAVEPAKADNEPPPLPRDEP
jgi:hypothetical protein